jgi:D-aminopeptidase
VDAFNTLAECKAARAEGTKRAEKLKQNRVAERAAIEADLAREIEAEMSSLTPNFDRVAEARRRAETRTNSLENLDSVLYTCLPAGQLPADLHLRLRAKE